jgi:hypothetical protein
MSERISTPTLPFKYLAFGEIKRIPSNRPGWTFALTLRFSEEAFEFRRILSLGLRKARLFIGIKSANVLFLLNDCTLPDDDWEFDPSAETHRSVMRKLSTATQKEGESRGEAEASGNIGMESREFKATVSGRARTSKKAKRSLKIEIEDTFRKKIAYIAPAGGPRAPKWVIEAPSDLPNLQGTILKSRRFARAEITGGNPQIEMQLEIPEHAIVVRDDDGIFRGINQQRIAKIRIKKTLSRNSHLLCLVKLEESSE